jgi:hypothetical protein
MIYPPVHGNIFYQWQQKCPDRIRISDQATDLDPCSILLTSYQYPFLKMESTTEFKLGHTDKFFSSWVLRRIRRIQRIGDVCFAVLPYRKK